ncbi:MAG: hypothetical protein AAGC55_06870 [Myxococcota bacterium]
MTRALHSLPLRWRLSLLLVLPVAAIGMSVSAYNFHYNRAAVEHDAQRRTEAVMRSLSRDFERIVLLGSQHSSLELGERLRSFPTIEYLAIYDRQGRGVLAYHRADLPYRAPPAAPDEQTSFGATETSTR